MCIRDRCVPKRTRVCTCFVYTRVVQVVAYVHISTGHRRNLVSYCNIKRTVRIDTFLKDFVIKVYILCLGTKVLHLGICSLYKIKILKTKQRNKLYHRSYWVIILLLFIYFLKGKSVLCNIRGNNLFPGVWNSHPLENPPLIQAFISTGAI